MTFRFSLIGGLVLASGCVFAQFEEPVLPSGDLTKKMGIDQKLGDQVPADATFTNEDGQTVRFGDYLGKRPIILLPMFNRCNGVCKLEISGLLTTLIKDQELEVGRDLDVIMLSMHPKETADLAKAKERQVLGAYNRAGTEAGFHFLVGSEPEIRKVTDAVGYRFDYNEDKDQIQHPAGIVFITPGGKVSSYIYGKDYPTKVVRSNVEAAQKETIGTKAELILLGCVMIDPVTGERRLVIENVVKVIGSAFALLVFGSIAYMSVKYRRTPVPSTHPTGGRPTGV